jgi:hypothetical protein
VNLETSKESRVEHHPYNQEPFPEDMRVLIIGTAPPPRFSLPRSDKFMPRPGYDADFFYGSAENYFWVYLERALDKNIFSKPGTESAKKEKTEELMRELLQKHQIGVRDIFQIYRRKTGKETSASDADIDLEFDGTRYLDINSVVVANSSLKKIAFTSKKSAALTFEHGLIAPPNDPQYFLQQYRAAEKSRKGEERVRSKDPICTHVIDGRSIEFFVLPSPSSRMGMTEEAVKSYQGILFT